MKGFDIYSVKFWIVGLVGIIILVLCGGTRISNTIAERAEKGRAVIKEIQEMAEPDAEKMISALHIVVTSGVRG